ncbi:hypothetical protein Kisp02_22160 [Kineosporia sp. NBRC 101731]|nr:amidohydrolase family protein [Kineosporia sp. NBRC 101731]GLY28851.1 hypothetical protein Kisp02_22160 [Kineosporia sp. NBRC 101731]
MVSTTMPVAGVRPLDPSRQAPGEAADLVVRNAKVHTGESHLPAASAVAIRNGTFVAVGDDGTVAPHIGLRTRVVDALGRRMIPGLNDSHTHVIRGGNNYFLELHWDGVRSLKRAPEGHWVRMVGGRSPEQFAEKRLPTIKEINQAAPSTPVFVLHLYQSALLNQAALTALG